MAQIEGLIESSPGVRTCMIEYDCLKLPLAKLLSLLDAADGALPEVKHMQLPVRVLHLPVAFNDEWTNASIQRCALQGSVAMNSKTLRVP